MIWTLVAVGCATRSPEATAPAPVGHVEAVQERWLRAEGTNKPDREIPVSWPRVTALTPEATAAANAALLPEAVFGDSRARIEQDGWADELGYELGLDAFDLLGLDLWMEGSAAYPDVAARRVVLDLRTGARLDASCFAVERRGELIAKLQPALVASMEAARVEAGTEEDLSAMLEGHAVTEADLDGFGLRPAGVLFHHDFGFPHVALALEPEEDLLLPWAELGPFLAPGCALARAVPSGG